jgi:hypothetical protein
MNIDDNPGFYPSVEEALADLSEVLPMLRDALRLGRERNPAVYDQAEKLVRFFESGELEKALRRVAAPDGTVRFRFDRDALEFLRNAPGRVNAL